jgi:LuxR family maltose regulon positive regulatory protein
MLVRTRLLDRLRTRWVAPVTVVAAPAGYGKTTLLAQAVAANEAAPMGIDCWVTCRPDSAIASSLAQRICRAVGAADVSIDIPSFFGGTHATGVTEIATAVAEAMWRHSPQQVALIIDDAHVIPPGSAAAHLLGAVVTSLPGNGHVVLAGRGRPPVPLARLDVEGRVARIAQAELMFTEVETAAFADLRGVSANQLVKAGGWPAMAELFAGAPSTSPGDYVGDEVLAHLPTAHRQALAVLAHIGPFDADVAAAALGSEVEVADVLAGVPLVSSAGDGEWMLHDLWRTLLEADVSPADVATARRRAAGALLRRDDRLPAAVDLLIEAEAWDELTDALVEALGVVHPPVARDVLADWLARLSPDARAAPSGLLLAALVGTEGDPAGARRRFEEAADRFHTRGQPAGELACVVQLGHMAWWSDDAEGLATAAERAFLMESDGYEPVAPLACLARALLYDIGNDSRMMLAELDKILPGTVNDTWWGIVCWARAIALLELGHTEEALEAANKALAHGRFLHAPLAQTTRLQALWYQGRSAEVLDALPDAVRHIEQSGYRNHTALATALATVVGAFTGDEQGAADALAKTKAAATLVADVPLVDANLSVAEAAVAAAGGDDESAAATLAAHAARRQVGEGMAAAPQQRHLALFYVLLPETRAIWDRADLGPPWALGRDLARALVAVREGRGLPHSTPPLDRVTAVQAHLPPPWLAELGLAAIAAGRTDGWALLDGTWTVTRGTVLQLAEGGDHALRQAARDALARLPSPPCRRLQLSLLGPVELRADDGPVDAADWRRGRVRMLLAYLAINGPVSRSQLAFDLWPDLDLDGQSRNLRVTLTYLLRVLEPDRTSRDASFFVRQHGNNISLHAGEWLGVDAWAFDDHCARARDADRQGLPSSALHHALRAVDLWRDDPVEIASEPWAVAWVEQRGLRFAATAVRAGELLLAQGALDRVEDLAGKALALDPWLEAGHRLIVATHRARGNNLAARRALQRYRDAVHDLGVDASEATMMVERLLDSLP